MRYWMMLLGVVCCLVPGLAWADAPAVVRIREVARVKGFNTNPLIGYGVVVGLQGTGDSSTALTTELLSRSLDVLGVNLPAAAQSGLKLKNMAVVMLTADLPAFTQPGDTLPITVSSMGDASSLDGGVLLMSSLRAADSQVYASAQGPITMPAPPENQAPGAKPHLTVGEVRTGGLAIREMTAHVAQTDTICWVLNRPDYEQASEVAASINAQFGSGVAEARDAQTVTVHTKALEDGGKLVDSIARMGGLTLAEMPRAAQVLLDKNSGAVLSGGELGLHTGTLTVHGMRLELATDQHPVSVNDLVRTLQQMGMSAADESQTLQLLHKANILSAEVVER